MPAQLTGALGKLTAAVKQFSLAQRTLALIGLAVLVLGAVALSSWAAKPTLSPLFTGLSATDASAVVDQLDAEGVAYDLTDGGGTVLVPADKLYGMRLKLAAAGLPANTDGGGYSLLDDMGMTSSEFQQEVTYQRALEGELAKTIGAMQGVEAATVKLALPQDSVFVSEKADPTASVFIRTKTGVELSGDQVQAIVHLVSAGIEGMKTTDVAVIDAAGKVLSTVGANPTGGMSGQQTGEYEARVKGAVQALLDQVVGVGKSAVTMTAELDYDQTQRTSESFTAKPETPPLASSTTTEEYTGTGGGNATGVLGPDNIAVPSGEAGNGTYTSTSEDVTNAIDKVTEQTTTAPGSVKRQSLAVVVDAEATAAMDLAALTATLSAAAGIDAARGDTIAVQQMLFDTSAAETAQDALAAADRLAEKEQQETLIRQAAIAGVVLLVVLALIIAAARRSRRSRRESLDIGELLPIREPDPIGIEGAGDGLPALPVGDTVPELPDALAVKRAEISALADEQPAEVADLLRGWLTTSGSGRR
ncbi:flagellar basal-body MS-ring/collar protein FliF [Cellulomonas cellasea]|uniref:Flagellar M-ring protein n=2 Tax=Cellulomonas cellasea TaxID=43670 RepID=A0A0A0B5P2_9CELL|nr:flagellar basal-body MS-ring/collar protein FliF [Cellulomonas cellasea]KGM01144.1 flagellar M-ring protein FliF [Cellulomonas cellasea DSM 20118]GEA90142.1 flagellar M-ring protein [Cellulomonas cellasea]